MKPGIRIVWWGWRCIYRRPFWLTRNLTLPGGQRMAFELGVLGVSIAKVDE